MYMYIFVFNWYMFASSFETGHNLTKKLSKLLFQKLWMQCVPTWMRPIIARAALRGGSGG